MKNIFISYAADDPVWDQASVLELARAIDAVGAKVVWDVRHQASQGRKLSLAEWRDWMNSALQDSHHVLCLASEKYAALWKRDEAAMGGFGVAHESIRMNNKLYFQKSRNHGWIATVRKDGAQRACIPDDLQYDCSDYEWPKDRDMLMSHVSAKAQPQPIPAPVMTQHAPTESVAASATQAPKPLVHQKEHSVELLAASTELQAATSASDNLKEWAKPASLDSPEKLVEWIMQLPIEDLSRTMRELRNCYAKAAKACKDEASKNAAASATAALYLLCVCRMVAIDTREQLVPVPGMEDDEAAVKLMASIVSVVLAGGRLRLQSAAANGIPLAEGTFSARLQGFSSDDELERALYATVVLSADATNAGLKTGPLTQQEYADLQQALEDIRNVGTELQALTLVVLGSPPKPGHRFRLAEDLQVPLFHTADEVAIQVLGMPPAKLISQLKALWKDVGSDIRPASPSAGHAAQPPWQEMLALLQQLVAQTKGSTDATTLQNQLAELETARTTGTKPSRDLLASTRRTVEGLNKVGDGFSDLVVRAIKFLEYFQ
ncbi:MAG: toll/interleukin-1 receptor domain-containing protein [Hydrogenophaga sp.]|nr:toll/interleukin-1 receptor domain-containing protein [Hydrogenophaga sp.]